MKKLILSLIFTFLIIPSVNASFTDVSENTKYQEAIILLQEQGIINGYADGTFKPDNTLNRAELLKILIEAANPDVVPDLIGDPDTNSEYANCFPDVRDEWFAPYVCYAKEQGIIGGYPDGTFKPGNTINKVEAVKILINSFDFDIPEKATEDLYEDTDLSQWYAPYLQTAKEKNILDEENVFSPSEQIKRNKISNYTYRSLAYSMDGFEFLKNTRFSKNKYFAFYENKLLKEADPKTFEALSERYAKDKNHAYYFDKIISNSDGSTFELFEENPLYTKDKNHAYYSGMIIPDSDGTTFEIFQENPNYFKDLNSIYYYGKIIEKADPTTFEFFVFIESSNNFARDKDNFLYAGSVLKYVDLATLIVISNEAFSDKNSNYILSPNKNIIKLQDLINQGRKYIDYDYSKDEYNVYFQESKKSWSVDLSTFQPFSENYLKDKNGIYYYDHDDWKDDFFEIKEADKATFEYLNYKLAKDKNNVYLYGKNVDISDPDSFEVINKDLSKDKENVYYTEIHILTEEEPERIEELIYPISSNPDSFEILNEDFFRDRENVYVKYYYHKESDNYSTRKIKSLEDANKASFEVLGTNNCSFAKDKNNFYTTEKTIYPYQHNINMDTVISSNNCFIRDKNYFYHFIYKIPVQF